MLCLHCIECWFQRMSSSRAQTTSVQKNKGMLNMIHVCAVHCFYFRTPFFQHDCGVVAVQFRMRRVVFYWRLALFVFVCIVISYDTEHGECATAFLLVVFLFNLSGYVADLEEPISTCVHCRQIETMNWIGDAMPVSSRFHLRLLSCPHVSIFHSMSVLKLNLKSRAKFTVGIWLRICDTKFQKYQLTHEPQKVDSETSNTQSRIESEYLKCDICESIYVFNIYK